MRLYVYSRGFNFNGTVWWRSTCAHRAVNTALTFPLRLSLIPRPASAFEDFMGSFGAQPRFEATRTNEGPYFSTHCFTAFEARLCRRCRYLLCTNATWKHHRECRHVHLLPRHLPPPATATVPASSVCLDTACGSHMYHHFIFRASSHLPLEDCDRALEVRYWQHVRPPHHHCL